MLLFWSPDRTLELWVRSHNWTHRALLGLNVEASLVVRTHDSAPLFRTASSYLASIRRISEPFDAAKLNFYREVQRRTTTPATPVIELEADDAGRFAGTMVAIFGTDTAELTPLDTMRDVHVALLDRGSGTQYLYSATILHSGLLAASDAAAGGLTFSPRRHAFRRGRCFAVVGPEEPIAQTLLDSARYFVTLRLGDLLPALSLNEEPRARVTLRPVPSEESPLLPPLDADAMRRLFRGKEPCVERATVTGVGVRGGR